MHSIPEWAVEPQDAGKVFVLVSGVDREDVQRICIDEKRAYRIGRNTQTCDFPVPDKSASRVHACIAHKLLGDAIVPMLQDFDSLHGTFVNDNRLDKGGQIQLAEGDIISIGQAKKTFKLQMGNASEGKHAEAPTSVMPPQPQAASGQDALQPHAHAGPPLQQAPGPSREQHKHRRRHKHRHRRPSQELQDAAEDGDNAGDPCNGRAGSEEPERKRPRSLEASDVEASPRHTSNQQEEEEAAGNAASGEPGRHRKHSPIQFPEALDHPSSAAAAAPLDDAAVPRGASEDGHVDRSRRHRRPHRREDAAAVETGPAQDGKDAERRSKSRRSRLDHPERDADKDHSQSDADHDMDPPPRKQRHDGQDHRAAGDRDFDSRRGHPENRHRGDRRENRRGDGGEWEGSRGDQRQHRNGRQGDGYRDGSDRDRRAWDGQHGDERGFRGRGPPRGYRGGYRGRFGGRQQPQDHGGRRGAYRGHRGEDPRDVSRRDDRNRSRSPHGRSSPQHNAPRDRRGDCEDWDEEPQRQGRPRHERGGGPKDRGDGREEPRPCGGASPGRTGVAPVSVSKDPAELVRQMMGLPGGGPTSMLTADAKKKLLWGKNPPQQEDWAKCDARLPGVSITFMPVLSTFPITHEKKTLKCCRNMLPDLLSERDAPQAPSFGANRWDGAEFDTEQERDRFQKLMGVKARPPTVPQEHEAHPVPDPAVEMDIDSQERAALSKEKQQQVLDSIELDFNRGLRRKDGRTVGLGL